MPDRPHNPHLQLPRSALAAEMQAVRRTARAEEARYHLARETLMRTPLETVNQLVQAINTADLAAAVQLYEPDGLLVVQPGQVSRGRAQIQEALGRFVALKARLHSEAQQVLESGDLALYLGRWTLRGMDPTGRPVELGGESTDILRRQSDGRWLVALDNPWGAHLLSSTG